MPVMLSCSYVLRVESQNALLEKVYYFLHALLYILL